MTSFVLKIIACVSMFLDHIGYYIFGSFSYFNYIGRFAFPIFAFQISEGYYHTKELKKYIFRLFVCALLSQIPFMLFISRISEDFLKLNVIFTLLFGLFSIIAFDKLKNKFFGFTLAFLIALVANYLKTDYGFFRSLYYFSISYI